MRAQLPGDRAMQFDTAPFDTLMAVKGGPHVIDCNVGRGLRGLFRSGRRLSAISEVLISPANSVKSRLSLGRRPRDAEFGEFFA